ncbi:Suppressor of RPS4-RLD 1 [Camellia lanceoleosa]|uniref:Suppressor of RPS4-RLD 1 n=1 Tax=Camellia lanceoleosa TaxID=1840588 RepID=A0ACC0HFF9_9ERIC|nr:Suppressor of RPS4-RLD 1 [Camellia lanceoleosa]
MRWLALFVLWSLVEAAGQTNYGIVNFKFKDFHAAIEDLSASIKLDKDNKSTYTYLGLALSSIGEYRRAEEAHKKSIQLDPNFLEAWAHLTPVGNAEALNCYYAHGEQNPNFQRRSYWVLDQAREHIVLHYRDINEHNDTYSALKLKERRWSSRKSKFLIGNGKNMYDFTYVENVARAHICAERALASEATVAERTAGEAYFVTNMEPIKF